MISRFAYPVRHFLINKNHQNFYLMKPSVKRKALTKITPKLGSLILQSQKQIPTSLFSQNSNFFKKDARGNFIGFCIKTFAILCAENLVKKEDDENDGVPVEAPEDDQECVDDLQSIIMADLDILKDKKFYDYLLQSLNDHRGKLDGFDNVTMRPEFTQEFFASYWLDLMKCAHFDNVPLVTVEDHDHQGKIVNGFDSIHRSLFEVCESRIDLRLTTRFVITGIKLADEEETALRNLFMLILLFVSEWVADQQEDCPHITLKQPMARLVHACFSKLFKDIYYGKDESFKNFIFDENKENSPPFLFSPNRSFNTSDLSGFNITPNVQRHNEIENETILDRLSETNEALMKAVNLKTDKERKLLADYKHLQETINAQTLEMVAIKKLNDEYSEEKQSLQHNLVKTKNELIQIETEKKNEIVSLNNTVSELQMHQDLLKNQLANANLETDNLKNDIDELTEAVSVHKKNREELEEENKALQNVTDAKVLEFETNSNKLYEEKKRLEEDLSKTQREMVAIKKLNDDYSEEKQSLQHNLVKTKNELIQIETEKKNEIVSLNNTVSELQMHQDLLKNQLANATLETDNLKNDIDDLTEVVSVHKKNREELEEENKALQNVIDANVLEFETNSNKLYEEKKRLEEDLSKTQREMVAIKKLNDEYSEEKQSLQHNLVKTKNELIQIEIEKKNEIESLNNTISELQMHQDLLKNQLANATLETHNLKNDIDDLTEVVSVHNSVAAIANNNSLKTRDVATSTQQENRQKTSSCIPSCLMFFLFLILFFTMWIYAFGAIVPSWAYIQVHHDHLPPQ